MSSATIATMKRYFITATDTDAGKTLVTAALLLKAKQQGLCTLGLKPLAAGIDEHGSNPDARLLRHYSTLSFALEQHNPLCFREPIAPHIAADNEQQCLSVERLARLCHDLLQQHTDLTLIEGAGGWLVPLNQHQTLGDFCLSLNIPIILVVNWRLGCLNHAQLSALTMLSQGATLAGWISNEAQAGMNASDANLDYLQRWFSERHIPHLGHIRHHRTLNPYDESSLQRISDQLRWP